MADLNSLLDIESIRIQMVHPKDRAIVKNVIKQNIGFTLETCKQELEAVNRQIGWLHNPGLLSEVQNLRDEMGKVCDLVQSWK